MPPSEGQEGPCFFYPVVLGGFFALLVPAEKPVAVYAQNWCQWCLAAGCHREGNPCLTHPAPVAQIKSWKREG